MPWSIVVNYANYCYNKYFVLSLILFFCFAVFLDTTSEDKELYEMQDNVISKANQKIIQNQKNKNFY